MTQKLRRDSKGRFTIEPAPNYDFNSTILLICFIVAAVVVSIGFYSGYQEGLKQGYSDGHAVGIIDGKEIGFKDGFDKGGEMERNWTYMFSAWGGDTFYCKKDNSHYCAAFDQNLDLIYGGVNYYART